MRLFGIFFGGGRGEVGGCWLFACLFVLLLGFDFLLQNTSKDLNYIPYEQESHHSERSHTLLLASFCNFQGSLYLSLLFCTLEFVYQYTKK